MNDINNEATREMPPVISQAEEPIEEQIYEEEPVYMPEETVYDPSPKKNTHMWIPIFVSCLIICTACFALLGMTVRNIILENGMAGGVSKLVTPIIKTDDPPNYNVILIGTDKGGYRTDTMMVATYNKEENKAYVMQLPRDTYVENNGRRDKKLNSAYFSGIDQLKKEVKLAYCIDVDKYLAVELDGFVQAIDALGGVEVDVPINMDYDDPTPGQDLHIHIKKGKQVLDGAAAEGFVRFRKNNNGSGYPMGDLQRIQAQREFITALVKKVISADGISKIPDLMKIAKDNLKTDINNDNAYQFIYKILSIGTDNIEFIEAPGAPKTVKYSYFIVDREDAARISNQYFGGKNKVSGTYKPKASSSAVTTYTDDETEYKYNEKTYYEPTPEVKKHTAEPEHESTAEPKTTPNSTEKPDATAKAKATATTTAKATAKPSDKPTEKPEHTPSVKPTEKPENGGVGETDEDIGNADNTENELSDNDENESEEE